MVEKSERKVSRSLEKKPGVNLFVQKTISLIKQLTEIIVQLTHALLWAKELFCVTINVVHFSHRTGFLVVFFNVTEWGP